MMHLPIVVRSCALMVLFLSFSISLYAQGHSKEKVDPDTRAKWVEQLKKSLREMNHDTVGVIVDLKAYSLDDRMIRQKYRISRAGLIQFPSTDWIYVRLHSEHDDGSIGDLTIARDQDENYYYHLGHVCGGMMHFETTSETTITTSKNFFKYFKDDIDGLEWQRLNGDFVPASSPVND